MRFGTIKKKLDVKFYYGKKKNLKPNDFSDLRFVYATLDELCLLLQYNAMKEVQEMEEIEKEKEEEKKKEKEKKVFPIVSYECGRCSMKIPKGHMILINTKFNNVVKSKAKDDGVTEYRLFSLLFLVLIPFSSLEPLPPLNFTGREIQRLANHSVLCNQK